MTQHNFNLTVDDVELTVNGTFDHFGDYDVEEVLHAGVDIQGLLSEWIVYHIQAEAVATLTKEAKENDMKITSRRTHDIRR